MAGDGGLDDSCGEGADGSDDEECEGDGEHHDEDGDAFFSSCASWGGVEEDLSDDGEEEYAVEEADHPDVEFHIPVEDV